MFELALSVKVGIVRAVGLQHFPKDFEPTLTQSAQGACVTFSPTALFAIIGCCPRTGRSTQVGPKVDAIAKQLVAVTAQVDPVDLAGLIAHRSGSRYALEAFRVAVKRAIGADFAKKPEGRAFLPRQEENRRGCYRGAC